MTAEVKVGKIYNGRVVSIKDFGAFVEIAPETDGLCHVTELSDRYVERVTDFVNMGDEVKVKVILIDDQGRIKLSRKDAIRRNSARAIRNRSAAAAGDGDEGGGGGFDRGGGDRDEGPAVVVIEIVVHAEAAAVRPIAAAAAIATAAAYPRDNPQPATKAYRSGRSPKDRPASAL